MARFLGEVEGSGQPCHRLGSPGSGIRAQAQGWNVGVTVHGFAEGEDDSFLIYATGGSNGATSPQLLGEVKIGRSGRPIFIPNSRLSHRTPAIA